MTFELFVGYPDDDPVVDLMVPVDGDAVEVPAQVHRKDGELMVTLFSRQDGPAWTYSLAAFRAALDRAAEQLHMSG